MHYFFHYYSAFNRVPKCHFIGKTQQVQSCVNSGLNHIVQLVEIMQLGAKPQRVGDFPPLLSVAWSLFLMWLLHGLVPRPFRNEERVWPNKIHKVVHNGMQ